MEKAILDTNFILTCTKQKIDFSEELFLMGIKPIIPIQVLSELERITKTKKKLTFRENAKLSLKLLKNIEYEGIDLGKGLVDDLIVKFLNKNPKIILSTLDKELKKRVKNRKMVIRLKKKIEII